MKKFLMAGEFSRTKIVATIGPASWAPVTLKKLILAGMRVARMNLSHGDHKLHGQNAANIRAVSKELGAEVGLLADLPGPKIRLGKLIDDSLEIRQGVDYALESGPIQKGSKIIPVNFPLKFNMVESNSMLSLADGLVRLKVKKVQNSSLLVEAVDSGTVHSGSGLAMPGLSLPLADVMHRDGSHIKFAVDNSFDFLGVSFVSGADDIAAVRKITGKKIFLVSKIERKKAVDELRSIVELSDGLMVARGDLGVEMPYEEVPFIQKKIIELADNYSKPVIVATQMMESMLNNPRPTRAEITDITNSVLQGADAVMLSGETAMGKYPVDAVAILNKVLKRAEKERFKTDNVELKTSADFIANSINELSGQLKSKAIFVSSADCSFVRKISRLNPRSAIMLLPCAKGYARELLLSYGVEAATFRDAVGIEVSKSGIKQKFGAVLAENAIAVKQVVDGSFEIKILVDF